MRRRIRSRFLSLLSVAAVALLLVLTLGRAAGVGAGISADEDGPVKASQEMSAAQPGVQFYGSMIRNETMLGYVEDGGGAVIRWPASWASVEPSNTTPLNYDWSGLDSAVQKATDHGLELIITIADQPSWAAEYPMGPVKKDFIEEFVGALVERYDGDGVNDAPGSPVVRYFELYNEPDNYDVSRAEHGGWGYWGYNGAGYGALLQTLHSVVKSASTEAKLVFGGLALDGCGQGFDCDFLDDVLAACQGHDCFDVMNFHYFPYYRSNWELYGEDIIGKFNYVQDKMSAYGFGDRALICTETSWPGGTELGNDELQSRYVAKGFVRGLTTELDAIVWYWMLDADDPKKRGLLDGNRQPKPSYQAYETMTAMLGEATFERALTPAETGSSQLVGYRFERTGRWMDVVWTEDGTWYEAGDDPVLPLSVSAEAVRKVDKLGNEIWLSDKDDGTADDQITVQVGGSPFYLCHIQVPDFNGDGSVDLTDVMMVSDRWRCENGHGCYAAVFDLNDDGRIDVLDIMIVVSSWGELA